MNHIRKPRIGLLLVTTLIIIIIFATYRVRGDAQAGSIDHRVYCQTVVQIVFPDRRFLGRISHPPQGGMDAIQASITLLDHEGMPPRPWPDGWRFTPHGSDCYDSWASLYDALNAVSFGRATSLLDQSAPLDEANFRQAVLKLLFKAQFETADKLFPPARLPMGDE